MTAQITELDFNNIKSEIIDFIKSNPTFSDYNFEGSALNAIVDILAFNTHSNAYYSNMIHNEGFIDTAQKRSSVVSKAKELGYTPKSAVCSTAYINFTVNGLPQNTSISLPRGTLFTSRNDTAVYQFVVAESVTSKVVGTSRVFSNVKLVSGKRLQNFFTVDTNSNVRSIFTIPNKNVDITTLKVFVRENLNSVDITEYFKAENVFELSSTSNSYFIQESYDGFFQIYFGGGVLGKQPVNGNIVDIDYMVSESYGAANGCLTFTLSSAIAGSTSVISTTTQQSFGGSDKEGIQSIKYNAVKSNSARNRSITVNDYELILKEKFNFIKSVSVWGGEDNVPPVYGKVFISIQPVDGFSVSDSIKRDVLTPAIRESSILTILPEFVDPTYTNLEFVTKIKFNPLKTVMQQIGVETSIKNTIINYIDEISVFNMDYIESRLLSKISEIDAGIISVHIDKKIGFKMTPIIGIESNHIRNLNTGIVRGSIKSTKFVTYLDGTYSVSIKEIPDKYTDLLNADGSTSKIATLGMYSGSILVKEIGTVNLKSGEFNISYVLWSYLSSTRFISITCVCEEADIVVKRNQILNLDINIEDASIGLLDPNVTITEIYAK
jgi:hypothetical protein